MLKQGGKTGNRGPSLKGKVMIDTVNGQERIRSWPRKRGHDLPDITKRQNDWFLQANWATKYLTSLEMVAATEAVEGTPMLPRDILLMNFAGRLFSYTREDGKVVYPMASLISVSQSLDILGSTPGSILTRGESIWEAVPGPINIGGYAAAMLVPQPAMRLDQTIAKATNQFAGVPAYVTRDTTLSGVTVPIGPTPAGLRMWAGIYAANDVGYMGDLIAQGDVPPISEGNRLINLPFPTPVQLVAGQRVYVGIASLSDDLPMLQATADNIYVRLFDISSDVLPTLAPAQREASSKAHAWWTY